MSDDFTPTPEFERDLRDALEAPALEPVFTNRLRATLIARAAEIKPVPEPRRRMLRWAYGLLIVLFLVILFSPQIVTAMRRLLGYVPGVGLVEQSTTIRILAEPVIAKEKHLTVTVLKVVADSAHTFVNLSVSGIPPTRDGFPICNIAPVIRLPDGSDLDSVNSGGGLGMESEDGQPMSFETNFTYAPVPAGVETLTFILPCILPTPGIGPENWEIPLVLVPAPADFATPGVEIGATFESSGPKFATKPTATPEPPSEPVPEITSDPFFPSTPTTVPNGSGMYLDKVIEMEESYILIGNFTDAGDLPGYLEISGAYSYWPQQIEDADGKPVSFNRRTDIQPEVNWGNANYWAIEIRKPVKGPIKITRAEVNIQVSDSTRLQFNTGPNPQLGQKWSLNLPVKLGGYDYVIDSAEMLKKGYLFRWHSTTHTPDGMVSFTVEMPGIPPSTSEGGWGMEDNRMNQVIYAQNFLMDGPVVTGVLTVELTQYQTVSLPGPWTITWSPPAGK